MTPEDHERVRALEERVKRLEDPIKEIAGMAKMLRWVFLLLMALGVGPIMMEKLRTALGMAR